MPKEQLLCIDDANIPNVAETHCYISKNKATLTVIKLSSLQ